MRADPVQQMQNFEIVLGFEFVKMHSFEIVSCFEFVKMRSFEILRRTLNVTPSLNITLAKRPRDRRSRGDN